MVKPIAIVLASDGPHVKIPIVDPYWDADYWHDAARGDGRSYDGVIEWIRPDPGETQADVLARAEARAHEINRG